MAIKRTTIEIDDELLARAKRALGLGTTRATVEEALRRVAEEEEASFSARRAAQLEFFRTLGEHADLEVMAGDEMWR